MIAGYAPATVEPAAGNPALPRVTTTLAAGFAVVASLAPGLLPRSPLTQAVLTALLVALALGGTTAARAIVSGIGSTARPEQAPGRPSSRPGTSSEVTDRAPVFVLTAAAVLAGCTAAAGWQNTLRTAMNTTPATPAHWALWATFTAALLATPVLLVRIVRGAPRRAAIGALTLGVAATVLIPLPHDARAVAAPTLPYTRSGSAHSTVPWDSLGPQGRRFVADGSAEAVRVYIGLDSAPTLDARVTLALRELQRTGGLARRHLVLAVPTGSGWLDARAARGLETRFGGDVAVVAVQYAAAPSWVTFITGRNKAASSARALFTALEQRLASLPDPPRLYLYGQSLGAWGGSAIFADDAEQRRRTCATLWAGPPANAVHRSGATVLANRSDPVVHWSPRLLWHAPDLSTTRPDAPAPEWHPVLSFVQTGADLLGALDAPAGHGHRYGTDQGTAMGDCAPHLAPK
ncbi:alpha/beta-hydrolase family protein [Nocardia harenae]|uniref:alpha/beta-hydrolase family protein n=1 Tax=Nocardia harenae TaxID=358707 RepID=UPI000AB88663|nr:alpha/beta-hydrolase family protein [Nocardia harenae]